MACKVLENYYFNKWKLYSKTLNRSV